MVSVGCDWMNSLCIMAVETSLGGWKICRMPISMKPYVIPVKYDKCSLLCISFVSYIYFIEVV